MTALVATHDPQLGPTGACVSCGYGPDAPQHPRPNPDATIAAARAELDAMRAELASLVSEYPPELLAHLHGRVARVDAILAGRKPAPFLVAGRWRGRHRMPA